MEAGGLIECVPNFSTADVEVVDALVAVIEEAGAQVLDRTSDQDHQRSVITFGGEPEPVRRAAVAAVGEAVRRIDLRRHAGVHPRIGAADVVPFVPLRGVTLAECAAVAWQAGAEIHERYGVPVFFYEAAARQAQHRNLADVRRNPVDPDLGGPALHPSAGASVVGARNFLIAYNIDLETTDVAVAREIARRIRERDGGLPGVKALGLWLESRRCAQVSMNLVDPEKTGVAAVTEAVTREAARLGVGIRGPELIGMLPEQVLAKLLTMKESARFH